jgi:hypothetical protein
MRCVHLLGLVPDAVPSERRSVRAGSGMASEGSPGGMMCGGGGMMCGGGGTKPEER